MKIISHCQSCGHTIREYKRKLSAKQVKWLIWLVKESEQQTSSGESKFVLKAGKRADAPKSGDDYSRLQLWELIEPGPVSDPNDPLGGAWAPTDKGIAFIKGLVKVPSHVIEIGGNVQSFTGAEQSISDVLGEFFSYQELLSTHS